MDHATISIYLTESPLLADWLIAAARKQTFSIDSDYAPGVKLLFRALMDDPTRTTVTIEADAADATSVESFLNSMKAKYICMRISDTAENKPASGAGELEIQYCAACKGSIDWDKCVAIGEQLICHECLSRPFIRDDFPTPKKGRPATPKQLDYLTILGWRGQFEPNFAEASRLIGVLKTLHYHVDDVADLMKRGRLGELTDEEACRVAGILVNDWPLAVQILRLEEARMDEAMDKSNLDENRGDKSLRMYKPALEITDLTRKVAHAISEVRPDMRI